MCVETKNTFKKKISPYLDFGTNTAIEIRIYKFFQQRNRENTSYSFGFIIEKLAFFAFEMIKFIDIVSFKYISKYTNGRNFRLLKNA